MYEDSYKLVGALISFSLLSMQPTSLNLDKSFWKLIVGQKLDKMALLELQNNLQSEIQAKQDISQELSKVRAELEASRK